MSEPIFSIPGQGAVPAMGAPEPDAGTSRKSLFIIGGVVKESYLQMLQK